KAPVLASTQKENPADEAAGLGLFACRLAVAAAVVVIATIVVTIHWPRVVHALDGRVVVVRRRRIVGRIVAAIIAAATVVAAIDADVPAVMMTAPIAEAHARQVDADADVAVGERGRRQRQTGHSQQAQYHGTQATFAEFHGNSPYARFATGSSQASYCN